MSGGNNMQRFDSIIVGGGVIGASIAFELSTRGLWQELGTQ